MFNIKSITTQVSDTASSIRIKNLKPVTFLKVLGATKVKHIPAFLMQPAGSAMTYAPLSEDTYTLDEMGI